MHFFYLDESGDTGCNLTDQNQKIFILGGLSVADKKWNNTKDKIDEIISEYFDGEIPNNFELHSTELLSPTGEGHFSGHDIERRLTLVKDVLKLVSDLGHYVHYVAIDKPVLNTHECSYDTVFDCQNPYYLGFDYMITYMNWHVKCNLGQSARGMVIIDEKDGYHDSIEKIIHNRRYLVPNTHKVKWIVEFSYPVDSRKNPMIQLSDLIVLCLRKFFEIDKGYKNPPEVVRKFYAECFHIIDRRVKGRRMIERQGRGLAGLNEYLSAVICKPRSRWKRFYGITD